MIVNCTFASTAGLALCHRPLRGVRPLPVTLPLNGRDFNFANSPSLAFTYYTPPTVSDFYPPSGPSSGGTTVTVYGQGFGGSEEATRLLQCRFGTKQVVALPNTTDTVMRCISPPSSEWVA